MRIIGCGNPERGDDGAGLLVVGRLRELGIEALGITTATCPREATRLLGAWSADDDLILLDAVVTGAPPGTVHRWDGLPPATHSPSASTHGLGVIQALRLAYVLGRGPKSLRVYGIEGKRFEPGSALSPQVKESAEKLAQKIRAALPVSPAPEQAGGTMSATAP
jgi:hydrogenase maturation protease